MLGRDHFIQDCMNAVADGPAAIREIVADAVSDSVGVLSELGEPQHAGITPLYRSRVLMTHKHQMFSVVGIYSGREDNVFWRRTESTIEAAGAKSLGVGEVTMLGHDIIHSVLNPIGKMTCAIHVYGGDFFDPDKPRSEWDHETLMERPWNIDNVKSLFRETEARFNATKKWS